MAAVSRPGANSDPRDHLVAVGNGEGAAGEEVVLQVYEYQGFHGGVSWNVGLKLIWSISIAPSGAVGKPPASSSPELSGGGRIPGPAQAAGLRAELDRVREMTSAPFFIEQLADHARSTASDLRGSISLAEMLAARVARLPAGAAELLRTLAAAGRPLPAAVAFQAAGLDGDERPLVGPFLGAALRPQQPAVSRRPRRPDPAGAVAAGRRARARQRARRDRARHASQRGLAGLRRTRRGAPRGRRRPRRLVPRGLPRAALQRPRRPLPGRPLRGRRGGRAWRRTGRCCGARS